jgi:hypothetical protein
VGGGANASTCIGIAMPCGVILGEEVGGGTVTCACAGTAEPVSVIPEVDSMVGGGARSQWRGHRVSHASLITLLQRMGHCEYDSACS